MELYPFDEKYLRDLRQGERAVEEHFASYFGELLGIKLSRRITNRDAIADVRQETLRRVFQIIRSEEGLRQAQALGALVFSVCNKVFLETIRRRQREGAAPDASEPASSLPSPLDTLITEERVQAVHEVLAHLPEKDRRLLTALYLNETDRDALCLEFGVSRDYLRVLIHRASDRFRSRCTPNHTGPVGPEGA